MATGSTASPQARIGVSGLPTHRTGLRQVVDTSPGLSAALQAPRADRDTVVSVRNKRGFYALLLCGVLIAGLFGAVRGATVRPITAADKDFIVESYKKCGSDKKCIKTRIQKMVNVDPLGSVKAVLSMFENEETMHSECHTAMHLVGQLLKPRTLAGDDLGLGRYWISCNAAILHGAYENSELLGTPAEQGLEAYQMCYSLPNDMSGHCMHPIGHTVAINLPAEDDSYMQRAEYACAAGAWGMQGTWANPSVLSACLSGVHMNYRDNYITEEEKILHPGQPAEEAFPQCAASLFAWACFIIYYEPTLWQHNEWSLAEGKRLFELCRDDTSGASGVCAHAFGLALVATYLEPMSTEMVSLCMDDKVFTDLETEFCLKGLLDEYDNEVVERADVEERFCAFLAELKADCQPVLYRVTVPSPAIKDPALLKPDVDVTSKVEKAASGS